MWLLCVILVLEFLFIFLILLNYNYAWMHTENLFSSLWIFENGKAWRWEDFARSLNTDLLDGSPHRFTRPVSDLFMLVNAKFRAWCWNFIPPHPSFAFWWPLVLVGTPYFLFRFFRNMGCRAEVACAGVCCYISSIGFLVPVIMLFHPAKPLVNFLAVFSLFLASERRYGWFLAVLFFTFFCDETGIFVYLMAAFLMYPILRRTQWPYLSKRFLLLPIGYCLSIFVLLPGLHALVKGKGMPTVFGFNLCPSVSDVFSAKGWSNLLKNFSWLFGDYPHMQWNIPEILPHNVPLLALHIVYILVMMCIFGLFLWSLKNKTPSGQAKHVGICAALMVIFVFFHTFAIAKILGAWGVWHYGSLFPMLYFMGLTFMLQLIWDNAKGQRFQKVFAFFVLIIVAQGLLFTTYRADLYFYDRNLVFEKRWLYDPASQEHKMGEIIFFPYTDQQIFGWELGKHYKSFDLTNSLQKSRCKYLIILSRWSQEKQRPLSFTGDQIDYCNKKLSGDRSFFWREMGYLSFEL